MFPIGGKCVKIAHVVRIDFSLAGGYSGEGYSVCGLFAGGYQGGGKPGLTQVGFLGKAPARWELSS